ncbi:MAG: magnesium/cobalt efflux protein, partial [Rhodobacterales bacterium]
MGSSIDGSAAAQGAPDGLTEDPAQETAQRGFFGRLLSAFTASSDPSSSAASEAAGADAAGQGTAGLAAPGLGALRRMRVDDVS